MGAVAVTEQAIRKRSNPEDYKFNQKRDDENTAAAGAYVAYQKRITQMDW